MRYSYQQKPKPKAYAVMKIVLSATVLVTSIVLLVLSPEAWAFSIVSLAVFLILLDGLRNLLSNNDELTFLEIGEDSISFRREKGGAVASIRLQSVEVVIVSTTFLEIGTQGTSHLMHVEHGDGDVAELTSILRRLLPEAVIKERIDPFED